MATGALDGSESVPGSTSSLNLDGLTVVVLVVDGRGCGSSTRFRDRDLPLFAFEFATSRSPVRLSSEEEEDDDVVDECVLRSVSSPSMAMAQWFAKSRSLNPLVDGSALAGVTVSRTKLFQLFLVVVGSVVVVGACVVVVVVGSFVFKS